MRTNGGWAQETGRKGSGWRSREAGLGDPGERGQSEFMEKAWLFTVEGSHQLMLRRGLVPSTVHRNCRGQE